MLLSEVIRRLLEGGMKQEDLAAALGTSQQTISDLKNLSPDSTWEKHWRLISRLIPYCVQYGPIEKHQLEIPSLTAKEIVDNASRNNKTPGGALTSGKKGFKKASISPLHKGRNTSE